MGAALARALLRNGHSVTVWNRTTARAEPLVAEGAVFASSVAAAVSASPVVIVCVTDYAATHSLLEAEDVAPLLAGRVVVQLSTGTPQEARDAEVQLRERDVEYLDGAIMAIPSQIGAAEAAIFTSGSNSAFRQCEPLLRRFAGNVMYLGEPVGAASALDYATLSHLFGGLLGAAHGALICEAEGLSVVSFGSQLAGLAPVVGGMVKHMCEVVQSGAYGKSESSVGICAGFFETLAQQAREAKISAEFPAFGQGIFRRAMAAGFGEEEFAALVKVLRAGA
jgi:3-hydroxyisobutyrate dehydrogenase-like beta-hydroxyacid dehydrogenase